MLSVMIAPKLVAAAHVALAFWAYATGGVLPFTEVATCSDAPRCVEIRQIQALPNGWIGRTQRWGSSYTIDVVDADAIVVAHELGHVLMGLGYHAPQWPGELMSPMIGNDTRCLGDASRKRFWDIYRRPLKEACIR